MNSTFQNRKTGEFFERIWINGSHVGLVSLYDGECVKVKRSNLVKSWKAADDYRHVRERDKDWAPFAADALVEITLPAPDPPVRSSGAPPVRVGDKLPGPRVAPRPISFGWRDALRTTSEGEHPAPASSTSRDAPVRGGEPPGEATAPSSRPSEEPFWTWPYILAVVLAALFVVVMWIAVLS